MENEVPHPPAVDRRNVENGERALGERRKPPDVADPRIEDQVTEHVGQEEDTEPLESLGPHRPREPDEHQRDHQPVERLVHPVAVVVVLSTVHQIEIEEVEVGGDGA